ncbi:MAG TPA: hypothetical protein VI756_32115 [Blastocatellia bacterium]
MTQPLVDAEGLIKRTFSEEGLAVRSIDRKDYPGETIFVIYVDDGDFSVAAELGNTVDAQIEDLGINGFVTVRKADAMAGGLGQRLRQGVSDPRVHELINLIAARSRASEVQPSLSYIPDAAGNLSTAVAPRHHLIFGRRGAGKTALMVEAKRVVDQEGSLSLWVNLQTLRHERAEQAYTLISQRICDRIEAFYSQKGRAPQALVKATQLREHLERCDRPNEVVHLIPDMQVLIHRFLESEGKQLYLFLDELHYLPTSEQPRLLDMIHGSVRDCEAWLKVAGIRHLSRWFETDKSKLRGLQLGHDADSIDLDITLENPLRAKEFLEELLRSYTRHIGVRSLVTVFSPESLDRLVIASGAVPRDYLALSGKAIGQARRRDKARLVGVQDVNKAAGDAAQVKITELEDDAASAAGTTPIIVNGLNRVRRFCIDEKSFTFFRIDFQDKETRQIEYSVMQDLMDTRLIHLVDPSLSDKEKAGRRSEAYMLDLSQFSGQRLKRRVKVLDFENGHLVLKETGRKDAPAKIAQTPKQRQEILRRGPVLELESLPNGSAQENGRALD